MKEENEEDLLEEAMSEEKLNEVFVQHVQRLSTLKVENKYNRGIKQNLWEVLWPLCNRPLKKKLN